MTYEQTIQSRKEARDNRRAFLNKRVMELYSEGKKPMDIAKELGITEMRVKYYISQ